jgi:hypothetical protein
MPESKINAVRPDGTVVQVTPSQLAKLAKLGYRKEQESEASVRSFDKDEEEYYSSTGQKILTAGEGILSGASLGLADPLLDDEDTRLRAEHNPGTRLGSEIVGGIGGAIAVPFSPAGALAKTGTAVSKAAGGGVRGVAAGAAVEGAVAGAGQSVTRATLDGSPLTADSILAGAGWGSVYGAGIGGALGAAGKAASKLGSSTKPKTFANPVRDEEFIRLRNSIDEFTGQEGTILARSDAARSTAKSTADELVGYEDELLNAGKNFDNVVKNADKEFSTTLARLEKERDSIQKAISKRSHTSSLTEEGRTLADNLKAIDDEIASLESNSALKLAGNEAENVSRKNLLQAQIDEAKPRLTRAQSAADELAVHTEALKELKRLPQTAADFSSMKQYKAERVFGALDAIMKSTDDGLHPIRKSITDATEALMGNTGIVVDSANPVEKLRKLYTIAKKNLDDFEITATKEAKERGDKAASFLSRVVKQASARGASSAARGAGAGALGSSLAYQGAAMATGGLAGLVSEMSGIRAAVQDRVIKAVAKLSPTKNKYVRHAVPRIEPLAVGIAGEFDSAKDRTELAKKRALEIASNAGNFKEVLYNSISPLIGEQTDFAVALHNAGAEKFATLLEMIPRDPGTAFNNMESMWKPNPVQVEQFSRVMEVFHFPLDVIEDFMDDISNIDPIRTDALQKLWPPLYEELRMRVIEKLPTMKGLDYNNQARLANLLNLDIHSSFSSQSIASAQSIFMEVPEQSAMASKSPNPAGNSGGRPSKSEPPTPGQSLLGV